MLAVSIFRKISLVLITAAVLILLSAGFCPAADREATLGDYFEDDGNFYGGGVVPDLGQDVFLFADLPWEQMGISGSTRIPQWIGYGPSRWTFMTAPSNQMLLQGKLTDAGLTIVDLIANLIFEISKMSVLIGNIIVISTFQNYAADYLPALIADSVKALYGGGLPAGGPADAYPMWQLALGLAIVGLGITVAVHFMRSRLVQGVLNYALAVLILTVLLAYFAEVDAIAAWTNDIMDQGTALVVIGTFDAMISQADSVQKDEAFNETLLRITETTWDLLIGRPWALGQWGTYDIEGQDQSSLKLSENELKELEKNSYSDVLGGLFEQGSILGSSAAQPLEIPLRAAYIDKVYLGGNESSRSKLLEMVQSRDSIVHTACGQEWMSATRHVEYALLSLVPALAYVSLTISVGVPVFIAQIMMGIMLVFFPLAIILGISGDAGRRMLMSYSRTALGLLLTKIVYGLYLALVLALISVLWQAFSFSYAVTMICTCILMFYALKYRRNAMQMTLEALSGNGAAPAAISGEWAFMNRMGLLALGSNAWERLRPEKEKRMHSGNDDSAASTVTAQNAPAERSPYRDENNHPDYPPVAAATVEGRAGQLAAYPPGGSEPPEQKPAALGSNMEISVPKERQTRINFGRKRHWP